MSTARPHLPALLGALFLLGGCAESSVVRALVPSVVVAAPPDTTLLEDRTLSWREPLAAADLRGLRLLYDTPLPGAPTLAVTRSIVRANHRLDPFDALVFATQAVAIAHDRRLDYGFFCATLLQESSFEPEARSAAGAVGIAQFTLDTAADAGIDPFDWRAAMGGAASLLGSYVEAYDGPQRDPYALALAAYNAGPGSVAYYKGVPPYAETRDYIGDIYDRWARISHDATGSAPTRR